jgi:hypothetical protein
LAADRENATGKFTVADSAKRKAHKPGMRNPIFTHLLILFRIETRNAPVDGAFAVLKLPS